ncbi:MAG: potassium transporter TrkG, partial [Paludibacter sp.]
MNKEFNIKLLFRLQGGMLLLETFFLLISAVVAVIYNENIFVPFILPAIITFIPGITAILIGKNAQGQLGKRDGVLIVTTVWLLFSLFGMLPYIFSGAIPAVTDAFFETMSGFTTTGASILNNIESLPKSILFWRSITHWIGGLGIIVITMALLPMFGFSAMSLDRKST